MSRFDAEDADAFAAYVATRPGTRAEHRDDLKLAWPAARGEAASVRAIERMIAAEGEAAARRIDRTPVFIDEVRQALRIRLLVADATGVSTPMLEVMPPRLGLRSVSSFVLGDAGDAHAYSYGEVLSRLFSMTTEEPVG